MVGWVDYDTERAWLKPGEVNVGYGIFAPYRHAGHASRAVQSLMHHFATSGTAKVATLLIDVDNAPSLALARRLQFVRRDAPGHNILFARPTPPLSYSDDLVTIRRLSANDLEADLAAKDDEQIKWLWEPGQRETWTSFSAEQQREHARVTLQHYHDDFGAGPKWSFAVDTTERDYVAYVDCDLANAHVPFGEANIAYSAHPEFRGRGYVSRAVRLVVAFLRDHTSARTASLVVDETNESSLRVAHAVGSVAIATWLDERDNTMIRHVLNVRDEHGPTS